MLDSGVLRAFCISAVLALFFNPAIAETYDLQPVYVDTIGHYQPLDLYPVAVAADDQLVYIVDLFHEEIRARNLDGTPAWSFPYLEQWPRDIEVDAAGNLYVAGSTQCTIKKYSPSGDLLLTVGERGTNPGQFTLPLAFVLDESGNIFVADRDTELSKFDSQGNLIWNTMGSGNPDADLKRPNGVAIDSDGNIYVADSQPKAIVVFDPGGNYLRTISPNGTGAGYSWKSPVDIAITADDSLIVLDRLQLLDHIGDDQVFKLDRNGTLIDSWAAKGRAPGELWEPQGLTLGANNDVWVAGYQGHNVVQYGVDGVFLQEWNDHDIQPYELAELKGASVGAHGRLYVVDFWNQVVQVFDRYGNFDTMWGERGQGDGTVFNFPRFSGINAAGEIYIDDDHEVRRFDSEGNFLSRSDWISFPGGIDFDSDGNVWVTGRSEHTLRKYSPDLRLLRIIEGTGIPLGFDTPVGVAVSPVTGNLYLTDKDHHRVLVLDGDGNYLRSWGRFGTGSGQFRQPTGIAVDTRGLVYVSEMVNQRIQVFTADGGYLYGWDVPGVPGKRESRIWELAFDGDYFLYGPDRTLGQAEVHKWALVPDPVVAGTPAYVAGKDLGFYLWSEDGFQWHLRWSSDGVLRAFSGVITSTAPFAGHYAVVTDAGDQISATTSTRIEFSATEANGQDGIDIVTGSDGLIVFDLAVDGVERNDLVTVGGGGFIPSGLPLPLHATVPPDNQTSPVDLSGFVKAQDGSDICAMILASGQYMFSCDPIGEFSLVDLPRETDGTVKLQVYADGFNPYTRNLYGSGQQTISMTTAGGCPDYNQLAEPGVYPDAAGKWVDVSGQVLVGADQQTPVCAMVLANGQYMFSCDGAGNYALNVPLDHNGQVKLQVYADGFAPTILYFDEYNANNDVKIARASECQ